MLTRRHSLGPSWRQYGDWARPSRLVVAIPGPFDYDRGIGDFAGVAKFSDLRGFRLGDELSTRLAMPVHFINDVAAYAIGQYEQLNHPRRLVALTLGTGVGSAFLHDGAPVESGPLVPANGWVYPLPYRGQPIEETFSRRAINAEYARATGRDQDVAAIASLADGGEPDAMSVMQHAYGALAQTLTPWLVRFGADCVVLGGSIVQTWALVERYFTPAVEAAHRDHQTWPPDVVQGQGGEEAALVGAAIYARSPPIGLDQ